MTKFLPAHLIVRVSRLSVQTWPPRAINSVNTFRYLHETPLESISIDPLNRAKERAGLWSAAAT